MAEGLERGRQGGSLAKAESVESRWVFQDEDDSEEEEQGRDADLPARRSFESEEEEEGFNGEEQRLIRTGPRIDSFDVEALEVPGAQRNDYEMFSTHFDALNTESLKIPVPKMITSSMQVVTDLELPGYLR